MMGWYGWDGSSTWGWVGMILMSVFWLGLMAVILFAVIKLIGNSSRPAEPASASEDRALELLRERFARGEITADQFDQARDTLTGGSTA